ncbi:MAG TPA: HTH domain-containing protein [Candidatus Limnocylindria bacterium]|nr:HTH domain-containing protein [Candidatus Limnocylindria bacterium]
MSIRLDPRRVSTLKQLAGEAGVRPGDLVRQWVEERLDAARGGSPGGADASPNLASQLNELAARVAALEAAAATKASKRDPATDGAAAAGATAPKRAQRNAVSAAPATERVALHDEMIEVLRERGPMSAAELAGAIAERGRYAPPRSGKPLDAAMVSQRVSNPTYRSRFVRSDGRIGLAE